MQTRSRAPNGGGSHLRLSVTDRCNLRCRYCMPSDGVRPIDHHHLPSLEELARAVSWLAGQAGVSRVKITGGEPLARRGVVDLVAQLAAIDGIEEVSATTNGALLAPLARDLVGAGLGRVNLSLDTMDADRYRHLTRGGSLERALAGLEAAIDAGLAPIKLNAVLLAEHWREDVPALLDLAAELDLEIRFIELMQTGTEASFSSAHQVAADDVRRWLLGRADDLSGLAATGPARREHITWRGRPLRVGWITPMSHPFCGDCNRLRLDVRGHLRRCLMDSTCLPLVDLLGEGDDAAARSIMDDYLDAKVAPTAMASTLPMVAVGG